MSRLSPTVRHRRLIHELRRLRKENGLSQEEVARQLDWSNSKQIKIERGTMMMRIADVRALLALYGVNGKEREALIQLARDARQKSWWQSYGEAVPKWFEAYVGLEAEAAAIHAYQNQLVPGLLQTVDYARAVMEAVRPTIDPEEIERQVSVRMERQTLLTRDDRPLDLWAVLDEAVLHREVGNRGLTRLQLEHLVEIGRRPNVTIQVLPYAAGAHASMGTSFVIVQLPEETDRDVVYLDDLTSSGYLEEPEDLQMYRLVFDHLQAAALADDESAKLITRVAKDMK
jgi:transcriptional regulator with XRE-family HTH domain